MLIVARQRANNRLWSAGGTTLPARRPTWWSSGAPSAITNASKIARNLKAKP